MKESIKKHLIRTANKVWCKVLKDPRQQKKCSWDFQELMRALMNGMLSGCKNLREVESLSEVTGERVPDTTLQNFLVKVDPRPLNKEIAKQVKQSLRDHELPKGDFPIRLIAIDGKCLTIAKEPINETSRRTVRGKNQIYLHMSLRAMLTSSQTPMLLGQKMIGAKTNECGAFPAFIDELVSLYGNTDLMHTISIDAGMVSAKNAQHLIDHNLNYIMALKDKKNKPLTKFAVEKFQSITKPVTVEEERQNGNLIKRELFRTPYKGNINGWKHSKELWKVRKTTLNSKGKETVEERLYVTSLESSLLSNSRVLQTIRMHWKIENNSNWVLDTAWQEDDSPWCRHSVEFVSLIRVLAFNIISRLKNRRLRKYRAIKWDTLLDNVRSVLSDFPSLKLCESITL